MKNNKTRKTIIGIVLMVCCVSLITMFASAFCNAISVKTVEGKFYHDMKLTDYDGITDTYYQFRADDNSVWWILTAEEIGEIPDTTTKYSLKYNNNFTTECDCPEEWDCECYCYDDEFIGIRKLKQ